jgi:excisionase family DNA binding protein
MLEELKAKRSAMTVKEVAEILSLSQREIFKLAASNQIPHFKIWSSVRFEPSLVVIWLEERMLMPQPGVHLLPYVLPASGCQISHSGLRQRFLEEIESMVVMPERRFGFCGYRMRYPSGCITPRFREVFIGETNQGQGGAEARDWG